VKRKGAQLAAAKQEQKAKLTLALRN